MPAYEYKIVPAPNRAVKVKGVRGSEARFANAVETVMNDQAQDGWEYLRTDTLPCEERRGFRGRVTVNRNLLVFRRALQVDAGRETAAVLAEAVAQGAPAPVLENLAPKSQKTRDVAQLGPALRHSEPSLEVK